MKKVFALSLLMFSLNLQAQQTWEYHDSLFTYKLSIDSTLSYDSSSYDYSVTAVGIYTSDGKALQHIPFHPDYDYSEYEKEHIFKLADANFDGHNDIGLQIWWSTRMDRAFQFWFYDEESRLFRIDTTLNDIMNPEFNPIKKLVCNYYHSGGMDGGYSKYIWENNKLILIDDLHFSYGPVLKHKKNLLLFRPRDVYKEQGFITHTWLENGEMKEEFKETDGVGIDSPCNCE
jgi:hypothetical protein